MYSNNGIYKTGSFEMPPPLDYFVFIVFEKNKFEVDALLNANTLNEIKNGNSTIKN